MLSKQTVVVDRSKQAAEQQTIMRREDRRLRQSSSSKSAPSDSVPANITNVTFIELE